MKLTKDTFLRATGRISQGRIATHGNLHAFLITGMDDGTSVDVLFYTDAGDYKIMTCAPLVNARFSSGTVELLEGKLFVAGVPNSGLPFVAEFDVTKDASGLPATLQFGTSFVYGSLLGRGQVFTKLSDGTLICWTVQQSPNTVVERARRDTNGVWSKDVVFVCSSFFGATLSSHAFDLAIHPADKTVRFYSSLDGSQRVIQAVFSADGKTLERTDVEFCHATTVNGIYMQGTRSPNGELPRIAAVADPARNQIVLAFTNYKWLRIGINQQIASPIVLVGAPVNSDPVAMGVTTEWMAHNEESIGLVVKPNEILVTYPPIAPNLTGYEKKNQTVWRNGFFQPEITTVAATKRNVFGYRPDVSHFIVIAPDSSIRFINAEPDVPVQVNSFAALRVATEALDLTTVDGLVLRDKLTSTLKLLETKLQ